MIDFKHMPWYEPGLVGLTIVNGILLDKSSKLDKIALLTTSALVVDSFVTPWFAEGKTLHELLGLSAGGSIDFKIYLYERGGAAIGNIYMALRNLETYMDKIRKESPFS